MNLILWRHAQAHELRPGESDLDRALTPRGEKQARRMAQWLEQHLPQGALVLASPARRTEQTAQALGRKYRLCPELLPGAEASALLALTQWPNNRSPVLVVGHQPTLGLLIAELLGLSSGFCPMQKGAVWWLRQREREGRTQNIVVTVQSPEQV